MSTIQFMKKIISVILLLILSTLTLSACFDAGGDSEIIRIHIRANSNSAADQAVKLRVRDALVAFLTPLLSEAETTRDAERIISKNLAAVTALSDDILKGQQFTYNTNTYLTVEAFPARKYGELVFAAGEYQALILELGEAEGDNWWCVAFPPLCFVTSEDETVVYKSKLLEIFESWRKKKQ